MPADSDPICYIPMVGGGGFDAKGYLVGDTIPHFSLYDLSGTKMDIENILLEGKPVLLVGGSYTCPVFRNKMDEINDIQTMYGDVINVMIIYIIEAHPIAPDTSPYFGRVNDGNNPAVGISYLQPTTYGERKDVAVDFLDSMSTDVPVFIDGLCNEWWLTFGPAPNNGYLVDTNGVIQIKHGWFDKYPHDIFAELEAYLAVDPPPPTGVDHNGFKDETNQDALFPNLLYKSQSLNVPQGLLMTYPDLSATFYDHLGRMIDQRTVVNNSIEINEVIFKEGLYLYQLRSSGKIVGMGKMIIVD